MNGDRRAFGCLVLAMLLAVGCTTKTIFLGDPDRSPAQGEPRKGRVVVIAFDSPERTETRYAPH